MKREPHEGAELERQVSFKQTKVSVIAAASAKMAAQAA
jgi:hypothetical protein